MAGEAFYPDTPVSLISMVRGGAGEDASKALMTLCECYLNPAYGLVRKFITDQGEAQDVTHEFFEEILHDGGKLVKRWDPEQGRFRSYFRKCLKNKVAKIERGKRAAKRGGETLHLSFDESEEIFAEFGAHADSPDHAFDLIWADGVIITALDRLQKEMVRAGRGAIFEQFKMSLAGVTPNYAELVLETGQNKEALRGTVFRLRDRYRKTIRIELKRTMFVEASEAEIDSELEVLKNLLKQSRMK